MWDLDHMDTGKAPVIYVFAYKLIDERICYKRESGYTDVHHEKVELNPFKSRVERVHYATSAT